MKPQIENLIQVALKELAAEGFETPPLIQIDATKDKQFGDFASNIALVLAKPMQQKPRDIATKIIQHLPASSMIKKVEIAGPGFINFFLSEDALSDIVKKVLTERNHFGKSDMGRSKKVLLEFVSSNPTGPLHVGHGRHAAFGDVVANLLDEIGFKTYREYYVNDGGRQMDILALSVFCRYLMHCGEQLAFPACGYKGSYVNEIAETVYKQFGAQFQIAAQALLEQAPLDEEQGGDKEVYIDFLIARSKALLGDQFQIIFNLSLESILQDMRDDLTEFGVKYNNWFSEREFIATKTVDVLLAKIMDNVYEKEGAVWFRATNFSDSKDRVLVRSNGQHTYFANDVAYHLNKFCDREFDIAIDILGADHHGYIPRMKSAVEAAGINPERLLVLTVQLVFLYRGETQLSMSTRGGSFVTLRELREEVGNDAARFFYVMRRNEQPMDFDMELAKSQTNENPVYYVQYAYARICSVFRQCAEKNLAYDEKHGLENLTLLNSDHERAILNALSHYPELIVNAALQYEPYLLTNYLRELATLFHAYYNSHQFLVEDQNLRDARLALISAVQQTLLNGFRILGIKAPERM